MPQPIREFKKPQTRMQERVRDGISDGRAERTVIVAEGEAA
jgi:hypothetical protein